MRNIDSLERFCKVLYNILPYIGFVIGTIMVALFYRSMKNPEKDEIQAFIDEIEFAIDNGLEVTEEEMETYQRLKERNKRL